MFSVIFDMDGTLLDTQRIWIPAWDHAGGLQGFEGMGARLPCVCGMNDAGSTRYLEENFPGLDVVAFKKDARDYVDKNIAVRFKDGAEELMGFLKKNNIKIALASGSSRDEIDHNLAQVGATDRFDVIVGGSEVKNGKPAPDIFLRVAELLGAGPEACFVFEDSANGIRAGHAAGMKCIGVPDVVRFDGETQKLMFKELKSLSEAIELFEPYIK